MGAGKSAFVRMRQRIKRYPGIGMEAWRRGISGLSSRLDDGLCIGWDLWIKIAIEAVFWIWCFGCGVLYELCHVGRLYD